MKKMNQLCTFTTKITNKKYDHSLVTWKAWQLLSLVGLFGTMLNSFLLYIFYSERNIMASSVNSMIYMNTVYRLIYSTVSIHWRTYNMVMHQTLFNTWFERDQVKYDQWYTKKYNKQRFLGLLCYAGNYLHFWCWFDCLQLRNILDSLLLCSKQYFNQYARNIKEKQLHYEFHCNLWKHYII